MTAKHTREGYVGTIISAHGTDVRVWIEAHGNNQTEAEKLHALHAAAPMLAEALRELIEMRHKCFIPDPDDNWTTRARAALAAAGVLS